jgi:hypothetical protein
MSNTRPKHYGVVGIGRTDRFDVEIDEALDDSNEVRMEIMAKARGWLFRFALSSRDEPARILSFLQEHTGRFLFSELVVGSFHGAPVLLIKDNEFADRFWLRTTEAGQMVQFVLAADDLNDLTDAVAQAVQE